MSTLAEPTGVPAGYEAYGDGKHARVCKNCNEIVDKEQ